MKNLRSELLASRALQITRSSWLSEVDYRAKLDELKGAFRAGIAEIQAMGEPEFRRRQAESQQAAADQPTSE